MEGTLDYRIYKYYRVEGKIGKGTYGEVYKAVDKKSGEIVAIKKIVDAFQNITDGKRTYRELAYLLQLSHPSVIRLYRVFTVEQVEKSHSKTNVNVYGVFQYMDLDLSKTIHSLHLQSRTLEPIQRKYIALQILEAINYLHLSGLVHRDIKPSNILITLACEVKICDFGLVRKISSSLKEADQQVFTEYVASRWYRPPEIMLNGNSSCTPAIDMWSVGCVLAQMLLNHPIFHGKNTIDQLEKIFSIIGMPTYSEIESIHLEEGKFLLRNFQTVQRVDFRVLVENASDSQFDLIFKLLQFDPKKRPTAEQALNHPFFDEVRDLGKKNQMIPANIIDYSVSNLNRERTPEDYAQLVESLSVDTHRDRSQNSNERAYTTHHKDQVWFQEKSTRESNCGRFVHPKRSQKSTNALRQAEAMVIAPSNITKSNSLTRKRVTSKSRHKSTNKLQNHTKRASTYSSKSQLKIKQKNKTSTEHKKNKLSHQEKKQTKNHQKEQKQIISTKLKKKKKEKFETSTKIKKLSR